MTRNTRQLSEKHAAGPGTLVDGHHPSITKDHASLRKGRPALNLSCEKGEIGADFRHRGVAARRSIETKPRTFAI